MFIQQKFGRVLKVVRLKPLDSLLLLEYQDVYAKPKGLPPNRTQDHAIPLVDGADPV
jgi:hypothetical protein